MAKGLWYEYAYEEEGRKVPPTVLERSRDPRDFVHDDEKGPPVGEMVPSALSPPQQRRAPGTRLSAESAKRGRVRKKNLIELN